MDHLELLARFRARARHHLAARPLAYWLLVAALGVATFAFVRHADDQARVALRQWGVPVPVLVATAYVPAGATLDAGNTAVRQLPRGAVGQGGAVTSAAPGLVAVVALSPGQPVWSAAVARPGLGVVAARVPPGWRAVAVPAPRDLPLAVGDVVDVIAAGVVTSGSRVVATAGGDGSETATIVVAVPAAALPGLAATIASGDVTVALQGPS